ncbi:MAG: hypothetical protein M1818_003599 [Claussenomyces sp. TS43310]|nr:MAG: hypothetical protein M1818_003599 [Claussenomyces sp. TS43310]
MASPGSADVRLTRLVKFFNDVLYGRRSLSTARDGKLFIEGLCAQPDPATCAHRLISSPSGLISLQASVRFDTSPQFLNDSGAVLLCYLQDPSLEAISSGTVLVQLLDSMVDPPFFWDAFTKAFREGILNSSAFQAYAWLLAQLVRLPGPASSTYTTVAKSPGMLSSILKSSDGKTRILGQKILDALAFEPSSFSHAAELKPGGRHDNDFEDFRRISIMPTGDELLSKERPFLRIADEYIGDPRLASSRLAIHLDNQFRLLREDMMGDIREELPTLTSSKHARHRGVILDDLRMVGVEVGQARKRLRWGVKLQCSRELPQLTKISSGKRKDYLKDNRHILRNQSMACLLVDNDIVSFPTIQRNEEELAKTPATIILQLQDDSTATDTLSKMKTAGKIKLVQLDSAVFAYEPFLKRLQEIRELSLADELLHWKAGKTIDGPSFGPTQVVRKLQERSGKDLRDILKRPHSVCLDESQMRSLCTSLSQRVSLVQGPPGTGKSFIGALIAKVLYDSTSQKILVICFTNHALDQFLEELMNIGIPTSDMVRLGGKSTDRTKPIMLHEQIGAKLNSSQWNQIYTLEERLGQHEDRLRKAFKRFQSVNIQKSHIMEYLEFSSEPLPFFETFSVPVASESGMTRIGKAGRNMEPYYLLARWMRGQLDAGPLHHLQPEGSADVWRMTPEMRQSAQLRWQKAIVDDLVTEIRTIGRECNSDQAEIERIKRERDSSIISMRRIIACTTNGAAKYSSAIQSASPGVVLVEEAGEILESHVFTALGPQTEHLVLIGDHQQLRPKCTYDLSVAKGDGYDLNRSLFERLILQGFPHITLTEQHRMRPEISSSIRHLTYPDLKDAKSTLQRANLRGFTDNVIFVTHSEEEIELDHSREVRDAGSPSSKQNEHEAQMILKCVRYLAQQGYGSDKLVVLTPYLGQLKLLRDILAKENDPILKDLDKFDLLRAGLLTDATSKASKPSLRISTIDNYQGEESDIVLASLTRSNKSHDIGFMAEPERLNVLLSRARDALIMIGNAETFMNARKGKEVWQKFFNHLKQNDHIYAGFPVKCEKHPDRTGVLSSPDNFEMHCPDGGCREPCGVLLKCGVHTCLSSCHQLSDHSKLPCKAVLNQKCPKGHSQSWTCDSGAAPVICQTCEKETRAAQKKLQKAFEEQQRREESTRKHLKEVANLQEEIDLINENIKATRLSADQKNFLMQKRNDLAAIKEIASRASLPPQQDAKTTKNTGVQPRKEPVMKLSEPSDGPRPTSKKKDTLQKHLKICLNHNSSPSQTEWQRQKNIENASNPAIDDIMSMIGLEAVKSQVLRIKSKVETSVRQGTDLKKERLGLVLLGNPGTGKTTVARHFAKVLTSLQVLSGDGFVETTGSRLAHGGVAEVKKHLEVLENSDGGVYFIDEAYQLAEGHNYGGKTVLDFILAEIENLVGKVVFVFAGYRTQMEKFFEHNPGFSSRIPYTLHFEDYTDNELLQMLQYKMDKFYKGSVSVEEGMDGLYMRIAIRRLGRGRGRDGFGNARALENLLDRVRERQSDRLTKQRRDSLSPDDHIITKEDLIGPDPSTAILNCEAWKKLQSLTGLKSVKDSVSFMIDLIKTNHMRELQELPSIEVSLNRVFLGSPGTGKTTVAKLYGQILADIGLLSNGEVVTKNPSDFIGSAIGQSEANTRAILATTAGKVLIIDEAYMLYSSSGGGGSNSADIYKTAVIDTLVAEVQSVPGEDRCVLLLGYEDQMIEMFQNVNPGLTRRFQLSSAFRFEDFNDVELEEILRLKLKVQGLGATEEAVSVAIDDLNRSRNGLNFGNGGDVENLISKAKNNYQARQSAQPPEKQSIDFIFEPEDFDPDFNRASGGADTNLEDLFKDVIGCEAIVAKLKGYLQVVRGMRTINLDPRGQIPMNFIFKGPPGTGKTTTARKFGQVFYDLGFLSEVKVIECSATDLIGQYVGQTGPKTIKQLERGLGKVLFIDEAYRLGEGHFAQEAINELVDSITKPKFAGKLVVILAGYDNDMNDLLSFNEGLGSRFADEVIFPALSPEHCLQLLKDKLVQNQITVPALHDPVMYQGLLRPTAELSSLPSWGNARDVLTLAKRMTNIVFQSIKESTDPSEVSYEDARACIQAMLSERQHRNKGTPQPPQLFSDYLPTQMQSSYGEAPTIRTETETKERPEAQRAASPEHIQATGRDDGVPDAVWNQLQEDRKAAEATIQHEEQQRRDAEEARRAAEQVEREAAAAEAAAALRVIQAKNEAEAQELRRLREEARIRELKAKAERERIQREWEERRQQQLERERMEAQMQTKLRQMGVCSAGFQWIKQSGGYRCAGGAHFVSDGQLGT